MIFEKKTKWIPLVAYNYDGTDYMAFVRKGKSGMLYFKTKEITPRFSVSYNLKGNTFDINEQIKKILADHDTTN